ncbi:hypothetical protein E2I00_013919, partial [Balaenoptera physalus]
TVERAPKTEPIERAVYGTTEVSPRLRRIKSNNALHSLPCSNDVCEAPRPALTLLPAEASGPLSSLLDVVSSLGHLLPRAGRVLEHLPEFLHELKIAALLDTPDFPQASQSNQARSSAFGSFQSVMKVVCKEQASFFRNSDIFLNLPRVNELLGDDKEELNIPEDSTPFCLKLYQEILQSPNGALVWSFLKPVLRGKILYTPNTPEINKVIRKANHTFDFVGKLKTLSETLLNLSKQQKWSDAPPTVDEGGVTPLPSRAGGAHAQVRLQNQSGPLEDSAEPPGGLTSATSLEATSQALMQKNSFLASISGCPRVTYSIRTSILYSKRTDLVKNPFWKFHPQSLPGDGFKYNYIFVPLQDMIERAIISVQTGQEALDPAEQVQAIPYPCHTSHLCFGTKTWAMFRAVLCSERGAFTSPLLPDFPKRVSKQDRARGGWQQTLPWAGEPHCSVHQGLPGPYEPGEPQSPSPVGFPRDGSHRTSRLPVGKLVEGHTRPHQTSVSSLKSKGGFEVEQNALCTPINQDARQRFCPRHRVRQILVRSDPWGRKDSGTKRGNRTHREHLGAALDADRTVPTAGPRV